MTASLRVEFRSAILSSKQSEVACCPKCTRFEPSTTRLDLQSLSRERYNALDTEISLGAYVHVGLMWFSGFHQVNTSSTYINFFEQCPAQPQPSLGRTFRRLAVDQYPPSPSKCMGEHGTCHVLRMNGDFRSWRLTNKYSAKRSFWLR